MSERRGDVGAVAALVVAHLVWGGLLLARADRFCVNDCVTEMLPRLVAVARSFQSGVLPFWDANTFAGARPFWASTGGIYYPVLYPFYLLADIENPTQASVLLQLLPLVLHVTWASLGGYFFARRVIHLSIGGSMVVGLAFGFCPSMLMIDFVSQTQVYSYLPWITLAAVRALDTGARKTWAAGALLVGMMSSAGNPDMINRTLVLVGMQVAAYWVLSRWRSSWTRRELMRLLSLLPMVLLGMATFSFGWAGFREGISWARESISLSCPQVAAFTHESSASPASLLTLFYPGLFVEMLALSNFGGGVLLLSAASCAFIGSSPSPTTNRSGTPWAIIAGGILGFSILVVLGNHTPVFGALCQGLPALFGFPHPVYYAVGVSWGLGILAGIGISALTASRPSRRALLLCSWPAVVAALVATTHPTIASFEWENWFVGASAYVTLAVLVLLTVSALPQRLRGRSILAVALVEIAASPIYLALSLPLNEPLDVVQPRTWVLSRKSPASELRPILHRIADRDAVRFVGTRSFVDNQAWMVDGRSLLGMSAKPISPRFQRAFEEFVINEPYELWLVKLPRFLSNMNVGYLVADRGYPFHLATVNSADAGLNQLMTALRESAVGVDTAIADLPLVERTEHFEIRTLPSPLPYVYTQDRIFTGTSEVQLNHLLNLDLRQVAYVSPEVGGARNAILTRNSTLDEPAEVHFEELQKANTISKIDRSNPNRKAIEVEMRRAALLIIAETWHPDWHARVDGKEAEVWKVNYLQQGLWLDTGTHRIDLYFRPDSVRYGMLASAASLLTIILVASIGDRHRSTAPAAATESASGGITDR